MSHIIELEDAYFNDTLTQALRVVENIKYPELKKSIRYNIPTSFGTQCQTY